jgi:hypothetical protein
MSVAIALSHGSTILIAYHVPTERGGRREVELAHDGSAVRFNGLETDVQETANLLVDLTLGDQLDYPRSRNLRADLSRAGSERKESSSASEALAVKSGLWAASDSIAPIACGGLTVSSS